MTNKAFLIVVLSAIVSCSSGTKDKNSGVIREKDYREAEFRYSSDSWVERLDSVEKMTLYARRSIAPDSWLEDFLINASYDSYSSVQIQALKGLSSMRTVKTVARIVEMAGPSFNTNVRWQALAMLSVFNSIKFERIYIDSYNDSDWLVREASIKGLLSIKNLVPDDEIIDLVLRALADKSVSVRMSTLERLNFKNKKIYAHLSGLIRENMDLKNISLVSALLQAMKGYQLDTETRSIVISFLTAKNKGIRIRALQVLKAEKNNT